MKRITFLCGHYGSGKSEFSINLAIKQQVDILVDLDIVNPYFRSREREELLRSHGIEVVSSSLSNALGSDLPYLSSSIFKPFHNSMLRAIYDLGGDPVGAKLIRQFLPYIKDYEVDFLLCCNVFREESSNEQGIISMIRLIEESSGLPVTGLINNSNLLRETTCDDITYGETIIKKVSTLLHLPIIYTGIPYFIEGRCKPFCGVMICLQLYLRQSWL